MKVDGQMGTFPNRVREGNTKSFGFAWGVLMCHCFRYSASIGCSGTVLLDAAVFVSPSFPFAHLLHTRILPSFHKMSSQRRERISDERSAVAAQVRTRV